MISVVIIILLSLLSVGVCIGLGIGLYSLIVGWQKPTATAPQPTLQDQLGAVDPQNQYTDLIMACVSVKPEGKVLGEWSIKDIIQKVAHQVTLDSSAHDGADSSQQSTNVRGTEEKINPLVYAICAALSQRDDALFISQPSIELLCLYLQDIIKVDSNDSKQNREQAIKIHLDMYLEIMKEAQIGADALVSAQAGGFNQSAASSAHIQQQQEIINDQLADSEVQKAQSFRVANIANARTQEMAIRVQYMRTIVEVSKDISFGEEDVFSIIGPAHSDTAPGGMDQESVVPNKAQLLESFRMITEEMDELLSEMVMKKDEQLTTMNSLFQWAKKVDELQSRFDRLATPYQGYVAAQKADIQKRQQDLIAKNDRIAAWEQSRIYANAKKNATDEVGQSTDRENGLTLEDQVKIAKDAGVPGRYFAEQTTARWFYDEQKVVEFNRQLKVPTAENGGDVSVGVAIQKAFEVLKKESSGSEDSETELYRKACENVIRNTIEILQGQAQKASALIAQDTQQANALGFQYADLEGQMQEKLNLLRKKMQELTQHQCNKLEVAAERCQGITDGIRDTEFLQGVRDTEDRSLKSAIVAFQAWIKNTLDGAIAAELHTRFHVGSHISQANLKELWEQVLACAQMNSKQLRVDANGQAQEHQELQNRRQVLAEEVELFPALHKNQQKDSYAEASALHQGAFTVYAAMAAFCAEDGKTQAAASNAGGVGSGAMQVVPSC
jgi:hypothetical protein